VRKGFQDTPAPGRVRPVHMYPAILTPQARRLERTQLVTSAGDLMYKNGGVTPAEISAW